MYPKIILSAIKVGQDVLGPELEQARHVNARLGSRPRSALHARPDIHCQDESRSAPPAEA